MLNCIALYYITKEGVTIFVIHRDNCINITRGDSANFAVDLVDDNDTAYVMCEGDVLKFTVKGSVRKGKILLQKTTSTNIFSLLPQDTKEWNFGNYIYDIELITYDGNVYTVVPYSTFRVCEEVG